MYLHFCEHVFLAWFNEDLICLDVQEDKYILFNEQMKNVINMILKFPVTRLYDRYTIENLNNKYIHDSEYIDLTIKELLKAGVLQNLFYDVAYPNSRIVRKVSLGVASSDWKINTAVGKSKVKDILVCLWNLTKVSLLLKLGSLSYTLKLLNKKITMCRGSNYDDTSRNNINKIITDLNNACFIFPTKTKCLEWAMAFILIALDSNIKCNLVIGVQTKPFFAHAWVEVDGLVISDSGNIAQDVAIIYRTDLCRNC